MNSHHISEYIENLPLQKSLCKGYRPDEVYEVICTLSSMYNQLLSETYEENEQLRCKLEHIESGMGKIIPVNREMVIEESMMKKGSVEIVGEEDLIKKVNVNKSVNGEKQEEIVMDKELQKLKRSELLEIMLDQSRENEALRIQLEESNRKLKDMQCQMENRMIAINKAGNIADASLTLNGVFEAAQKAAQQYLDNLQYLYEKEMSTFSEKEAEIENRCAAMLQETKERCECMKESVEKECRERESQVEMKCREREAAAEEKCRLLDEKAKVDVDKRWEELARRLEAFYNAHEGLKDLMTASKIISE